MSDNGLEKCSRCGQYPNGQSGEYPCDVCGVPTVHDETTCADGVQNGSYFDRFDISELTEAYLAYLLEERQAQRRVLDAREAVEYERQRLISIARSDGLITGKNEQERNEQISIVVANTPADKSGYYFLKEYELKEEIALEIVEAQRKAIEAEISLTKAWLYSLSGGAR
jgi:hypothetical protein